MNYAEAMQKVWDEIPWKECMPMNRREAGKLMAGAGAATVAAWVAPEILTAKPAGGAQLSAPGPPGEMLNGGAGVETPHAAQGAAQSQDGPLAFTGANLEDTAFAGAVAVAGGWALTHWVAPRIPDRIPKAPPARPDV